METFLGLVERTRCRIMRDKSGNGNRHQSHLSISLYEIYIRQLKCMSGISACKLVPFFCFGFLRDNLMKANKLNYSRTTSKMVKFPYR